MTEVCMSGEVNVRGFSNRQTVQILVIFAMGIGDHPEKNLMQ